MSTFAGLAPEVFVTISGSSNIGSEILSFEWKSFVNGGYIVRAKVHDPYLRLIRKLLKENNFLKEARQKPTTVKFKLSYTDRPEETQERIAFISDIDVYGFASDANFEFIAVDPPSWFLNAGNGNGKVYVGNLTKVIKQVIADYTPSNAETSITAEVSETLDDKQGRWAMMRQDPKTFIQSMLDWSASLTEKKTHWIVASVDRKIIIKQQHEFPGKHLANYGGSFQRRHNDIVDFNLVANVFTTAIQSRLVTQGISTVSGKFLDKETEQNRTEVGDENTPNKINTDIDSAKGFTKPRDKLSTSIMAIPEFSGGELGLKYEEYIDGRARNLFLSMLPMVMRTRITVRGDFRFDDSSKLGTSTIQINWDDHDGEPFFMSGRWLVYGFHHKVTRGLDDLSVMEMGGPALGSTGWVTDLYLYRIDHDAVAQPR